MSAPCCCASHTIGRGLGCRQCRAHGYSAPQITKEGLQGAVAFVAMVGSVVLLVYVLAF